ncbi:MULTISPECIES: phosphatase PAP2/dual specificity phosphatase family protein [Eikenella]|uniref:PAP2 family protein n=2 Tax=Eikenella corrodens TaxID=539 RepID=C0DYV4_EIKCO|nr:MULTISPECIES: phosphatase PAP2/dual specificity phosphatase family protein [Eikenella]EEG22770.1 PAP2 family protein [Eikenella corrodens ATCC 23834]MDU1346174.1 phosphatase PAP2/dual specificity phosphatase family protein [Eikenella corrodens]OAM14937.1 protein phosphatase [Eikenella corrodens]OFN59883.1 protein phosphatase [Eikenella sp. HMSC061C02]UAK75398.1 phosphatase PAP2/dual specificity phosphatase family protein [Eikenella corrodens]
MKPTLKTSLLKLALVGALFYTSYGLSNHYAASLAYVPEVAFAWERGIPFWAWTIVPYWSLNLMYAAAFFLCRDAGEQNRYVARLVAAQIIATTCFMLFPLHFSWQKPPTDGLWGWLFDSLVAFDLPYNQAPSLHIALSIIVGAFYWTRFPKIRLPILLWQSLIALSVLTTYQHHFIDVPTGALLGWLVLWAIPQYGVSPFKRRDLFVVQPAEQTGYLKTVSCEAKLSSGKAKISPETRSREIKIAMLYLAGAVLSALPALFGGAWLWMLWVSVSLLVVAFAYLTGNAVFQKQADGRLSAAATILLLPYLAGVRLNMAYWLRGKAKTAQVRDDVWIGSISGVAEIQHCGGVFGKKTASAALKMLSRCSTLLRFLPCIYHFLPQKSASQAKSPQPLVISDGLPAVLDVCAEYPRPRYHGAYRTLPLLDMVAPSENDLVQAALLLEALRRQHGKVLTCCALGYGRSASVVLTWLLVYGGCRDLAQATAELKQARPQMVLPQETAKAVEAAAGYLKNFGADQKENP